MVFEYDNRFCSTIKELNSFVARQRHKCDDFRVLNIVLNPHGYILFYEYEILYSLGKKEAKKGVRKNRIK